MWSEIQIKAQIGSQSNQIEYNEDKASLLLLGSDYHLAKLVVTDW